MDFRLGRDGRAGNMYRSGKNNLIYVRFRLHGREIRRATGKTDEAAAREEAWQIFLRESGRDALPSSRPARGCPTVGEVVDIYKAKIASRANIGAGSIRKNAAGLLNALQLVWPSRNPKNIRLDELDHNVIYAWRKERRKLAKAPADGSDLRNNSSINSACQDFKSVFSKQARMLYLDEGLTLPDLTRFLGVQGLKPPRVYWRQIPEAVVAAMDKDILEVEDPRVRIVYELARYGGLRQGEILAAQRGWLELVKGNWELGIIHRPGYSPKVRDRWVSFSQERIDSWIELMGREWWDNRDGYLIPGPTMTARQNLVQRTACEWIATYLPDRGMKLHELRKQAGCDIATREMSYDAAALFLGDTSAVAEKHYAHILKQLKPL